MKADEFLERYKNGERNFRRVNLRGQSFKGKDLSEADFSEADIRGANFTNAILKGAKFRAASAGLQRRWAIGLVAVSWLLSGILGILGIFSLLISDLVASTFNTINISSFITGTVTLIVVAVFFIVTVRKGLAAGLGAVAGGGAVAVAVAGAVAGATAAAGAVVVAGAGATAAAGAGAGATGAVAAAVVALLGAYIGWRGLAGDEKHAWVRPVANAFAAIGGTSFCGADLTDANFTSATLKSTDFRGAILTRTCWHQAKKLECVRPGTTYLRNTQLRQWLTGKQQNKNFDRQDLRGVNLKGANLADASFIGANLSEANLQDADLSRAKLVQTQLDKTDLTGATLTGACIEDWGITSHTQLDRIKCEYIFMRLETKENPNPRRQPENWAESFEDSDFADFINPIVNTWAL